MCWLLFVLQLEELDLSSNKFADGLTDAIGKLDRLRKLRLCKCGLPNVPNSIGDLKQVRSFRATLTILSRQNDTSWILKLN